MQKTVGSKASQCAMTLRGKRVTVRYWPHRTLGDFAFWRFDISGKSYDITTRPIQQATREALALFSVDSGAEVDTPGDPWRRQNAFLAVLSKQYPKRDKHASVVLANEALHLFLLDAGNRENVATKKTCWKLQIKWTDRAIKDFLLGGHSWRRARPTAVSPNSVNEYLN